MTTDKAFYLIPWGLSDKMAKWDVQTWCSLKISEDTALGEEKNKRESNRGNAEPSLNSEEKW